MSDEPKRPVLPSAVDETEPAWEDLFGAEEAAGVTFATEETYLQAYDGSEEDEASRQLLSFQVGNEGYAVDLHRVKEILKYRPSTPVPRTRAFVEGIVAVRGVVMPVVNLARRLGLDVLKPTTRSRILVVGETDQLYGLVVDGVSGVKRSADLHVEPVPQVMNGAETEFLDGIARMDDEMFILLNLDILLDFEAAS